MPEGVRDVKDVGVKLGQDCRNLGWGSGLLVPRAGARGPLVLLRQIVLRTWTSWLLVFNLVFVLWKVLGDSFLDCGRF